MDKNTSYTNSSELWRATGVDPFVWFQNEGYRFKVTQAHAGVHTEFDSCTTEGLKPHKSEDCIDPEAPPHLHRLSFYYWSPSSHCSSGDQSARWLKINFTAISPPQAWIHLCFHNYRTVSENWACHHFILIPSDVHGPLKHKTPANSPSPAAAGGPPRDQTPNEFLCQTRAKDDRFMCLDGYATAEMIHHNHHHNHPMWENNKVLFWGVITSPRRDGRIETNTPHGANQYLMLQLVWHLHTAAGRCRDARSSGRSFTYSVVSLFPTNTSSFSKEEDTTEDTCCCMLRWSLKMAYWFLQTDFAPQRNCLHQSLTCKFHCWNAIWSALRRKNRKL